MMSAWLPGPMFLLVRSLSLVPCSFWGSLSRGVSIQGCVSFQGVSMSKTPPSMVKSGLFVSYWNAFLFGKIIVWRPYFRIGGPWENLDLPLNCVRWFLLITGRKQLFYLLAEDGGRCD